MSEDRFQAPVPVPDAEAPRSWRQIEREQRQEQLHELLRDRIALALHVLNNSTGLAAEGVVRRYLDEMRALLDYPRPPTTPAAAPADPDPDPDRTVTAPTGLSRGGRTLRG